MDFELGPLVWLEFLLFLGWGVVVIKFLLLQLVPLDVGLQIAVLSEPFTANVALEWLDALMRPLVDSQALLPLIVLAAVRAFEGFLAGVNPNVRIQMALGNELLGATRVRASKRSVAGVRPQVNVEIARDAEEP